MEVLTAKRRDMCYCPGCSHGALLEHLGLAIDRLGLRPEQLCLVSDIGCIGTADRYFACHTFHGLHGRAVTYAEGIKRIRPDLLVVVLIGDGGCGIGTAHLVHAARRGADIKVIVADNFNFGMTGGQHSPTTPPGASTPTTPGGAACYPLDVCTLVGAGGAAYVARHSALDRNCADHLERALRAPGFALVDVWELCTAYFVPSNHLTPLGLNELSQQLNRPFGVLVSRPPSADSGPTFENSPPAPAHPAAGVKKMCWAARTEICMAGSAGQHIRSAAGVIGEIAVAAGLFAAQQDDFPITVRRGHSVTDLVIDARPILYAGVDEPDIVVLLSTEGLQRLRILDRIDSRPALFADQRIDLPAGRCQGAVRFDVHDLERRAGKSSAALAVLTAALVNQGLIEPCEFRSAAQSVVAGKYRQERLNAIDVGLSAPLASNTASGATPQGTS